MADKWDPEGQSKAEEALQTGEQKKSKKKKRLTHWGP